MLGHLTQFHSVIILLCPHYIGWVRTECPSLGWLSWLKNTMKRVWEI